MEFSLAMTAEVTISQQSELLMKYCWWQSGYVTKVCNNGNTDETPKSAKENENYTIVSNELNKDYWLYITEWFLIYMTEWFLIYMTEWFLMYDFSCGGIKRWVKCHFLNWKIKRGGTTLERWSSGKYIKGHFSGVVLPCNKTTNTTLTLLKQFFICL
jgi:hypothetical protein